MCFRIIKVAVGVWSCSGSWWLADPLKRKGESKMDHVKVRAEWKLALKNDETFESAHAITVSQQS